MDVNEDELLGEPLDEIPEKPADYDCNARKWDERGDGAKVFKGYCGARAGKGTGDVGEGRCSKHGGASDGAPEGNDNAVTTGAFREHFTSHLTEAEMSAFDEARGLLEEPSGAQEIARTAATICLLQFDRSGDERFMRRFESICDKFSIAPEDVERHEHTGEGGGPIEVTINRERYDGE